MLKPQEPVNIVASFQVGDAGVIVHVYAERHQDDDSRETTVLLNTLKPLVKECAHTIGAAIAELVSGRPPLAPVDLTDNTSNRRQGRA